MLTNKTFTVASNNVSVELGALDSGEMFMMLDSDVLYIVCSDLEGNYHFANTKDGSLTLQNCENSKTRVAVVQSINARIALA